MFARVAIIALVCDFIGMPLLVLHRGTFIVARTVDALQLHDNVLQGVKTDRLDRPVPRKGDV